MKKCPGCGSIGSDEETTCGVCGENLSNISSMTQTIEQTELEDESKRHVEERILIRQMQKKGILKALGGIAVGLAILIPGLVFESLWSILLIPLGLIVLGTAILGGLGQGGLIFPGTSGATRTQRKLMREERDEERERRGREGQGD